MLDKLSRKILKYMRKNSDVGRENFNRGVFEISKGISEKPENVRLAIIYLNECGFIIRCHNRKGNVMGFKLSHTGLHRTEVAIKNLLVRWADRIISFILGVLTTIVAQVIMKWISK